MTTLKEWADDLRQASIDVMDEGEKVISKGALNIKNDWRDRWTGYKHIPHLPHAISYDVDRHEDTVEAEIGPVRGELQAGLASYIEYGTPTSGPIPGLHPATDAEEPRLTRELADLGKRLLVER